MFYDQKPKGVIFQFFTQIYAKLSVAEYKSF